MKIISCHFGTLTTEESSFSKDVILTNSRAYPNWWRKEGHKLHWQDVARFVDETRPEVLVVGQGQYGAMSILPEVVEEVNRRNIQLFASPTARAVEDFNRLVDQVRILGAFHLTC